MEKRGLEWVTVVEQSRNSRRSRRKRVFFGSFCFFLQEMKIRYRICFTEISNSIYKMRLRLCGIYWLGLLCQSDLACFCFFRIITKAF